VRARPAPRRIRGRRPRRRRAGRAAGGVWLVRGSRVRAFGRAGGGEVGGQQFLELRDAAGDAGLHRAQRHAQDFGDFLVSIVFEIKEGNGRLIGFIHLAERAQDDGAIQPVGEARGDGGQIKFYFIQFLVWETRSVPPALKELTVQRRKQPRFHFGRVPQL